MKRSIRSIALGSAALVAAGTLIACGSSDSGTAAGGTVTLQMIESLSSPDRTTLLKSMLATFESQNPGIKVHW